MEHTVLVCYQFHLNWSIQILPVPEGGWVGGIPVLHVVVPLTSCGSADWWLVSVHVIWNTDWIVRRGFDKYCKGVIGTCMLKGSSITITILLTSPVQLLLLQTTRNVT